MADYAGSATQKPPPLRAELQAALSLIPEPVRASDGILLYWIGINLDIEDRKQAQFYLAEGQRLAHMGSWAFNAAGFD